MPGADGRGLRQALVRMVRAIAGLVVLLEVTLRVRRERRALLAMNDRMLKDMGLDRGELYAETERWFWDVPRDRLHL